MHDTDRWHSFVKGKCLGLGRRLWGDVLGYSFAYNSSGSFYSAAFLAAQAREPGFGDAVFLTTGNLGIIKLEGGS